MNLNPAPFAMIDSGEKTIELRLNDEKRQKIKSGDEIVFVNTENGGSLLTRVKNIYCFPTFKELYRQLPLLQCGYTEQNIADAKPEDMDVYYSKERQAQYGVLGIEIEKEC